jgi:Predicted membrane protein
MKTPIIGRDNCIHAGIRLAIEDPEDADSNAIFAAVKLYEELLSKGYKSEVALLSGSYNRGVEADERIVYQLQDVLSKFNANAAIMVSDGVDDEAVLPIIQGILPVISVQRVIIRHSKSVEYSYALFGRYIKSLIYDPRYSKFFLGIPGALLLASGLSIVLNFAEYLMPILFIILGSIFIVRAFDVDRAIINFTRSSSPSSFIRIFSLLAGIMIILAGINAGYVSAISFVGNNSNDILNILLNRHIIASFITNMLPLLWIGLGVIFGGHLLSNVFKSNARLLSDSLRLVVLGLFYIPAQQMVNMIEGEVNPFTLISSLLLGLAITLIAATLVYEYYRKKSNSSTLPSNSNKSNHSH